jgi:hypothetical protein
MHNCGKNKLPEFGLYNSFYDILKTKDPGLKARIFLS